jgi:hypothetical protein
MLVFALGVAAAHPSDIFRYSDEDTKQSHFMEGEAGTKVNGGWEFEAPEGKSYKLTYQADEMGFQPQADYLPLQVNKGQCYNFRNIFSEKIGAFD